MNKADSLKRLANEYISKCNCCDECFAEIYCILNDRRTTKENCPNTIVEYLKSL